MSENQLIKNNIQNSSARSCTLVIPGLLDMPTAERESAFSQAGRLPELERFFSRAQRQNISGVGLEASLFSLFKSELPSDVDLPVAAVAHVGETGEQKPTWRLRADPVQLIPDRDQLVLMGPESLSLTQTEADQLVAELNEQFAQDGWSIEACTPSQWYLSQADIPKLRTHDLAQVRGHSIAEYLPKGVDGKHWHRLMNEVQMVLHSSAVNQRRQLEGLPPVTSLWFWGGGEIPKVEQCCWSELRSNEPVSLGLAVLSNTPHKNSPEHAAAWLNESTLPGDHLIVLDDLSRHWQHGKTEAWLQQVRKIEREWMMPLLDALRRKEISELTFCACNGSQFTLTRAGLRRWWRRKNPLSSFAAQENN